MVVRKEQNEREDYKTENRTLINKVKVQIIIRILFSRKKIRSIYSSLRHAIFELNITVYGTTEVIAKNVFYIFLVFGHQKMFCTKICFYQKVDNDFPHEHKSFSFTNFLPF